MKIRYCSILLSLLPSQDASLIPDPPLESFLCTIVAIKSIRVSLAFLAWSGDDGENFDHQGQGTSWLRRLCRPSYLLHLHLQPPSQPMAMLQLLLPLALLGPAAHGGRVYAPPPSAHLARGGRGGPRVGGRAAPLGGAVDVWRRTAAVGRRRPREANSRSDSQGRRRRRRR